MFSQTAEYALRAVVWLASHPDDCPLGAQRIAAGTQVPSSYLAKILQELAKAGIVSSRRGVGGGFDLSRPADELTVLEVVDAVDPFQRITGCPLQLATHRERLCPMHHRLDEALAVVEDTLRRTRVADILKSPTRPLPMIESS